MSKIDRLVGVKVFGWSIVTDSDGEPLWSNDCGTPLAFQYASAPVKFGPNFSNEIAAAWEVVEHLRGRGLTFTISDNDNPKTRLFYCSFIGIDGNLPPRGWAHDLRPCVAICLAALRAVGVSEGEIQEAGR